MLRRWGAVSGLPACEFIASIKCIVLINLATTGAGTNASGGENNANVGSSGFRKGMAIFTIAKGGLMYEATRDGQKFSYKPAD